MTNFVSFQDFLQNSELISRIASALLKGEFYERGGNLYEKIRDYQKAMECYRRGKAYRQGKGSTQVFLQEDV